MVGQRNAYRLRVFELLSREGSSCEDSRNKDFKKQAEELIYYTKSWLSVMAEKPAIQ